MGMRRIRKYSLFRRALTVLEMVLAMSIMMIVFAALLPQFRVVLNSWDTREANSEIIQNARVLLDHIEQNLSKATKITAVSDPATTTGFIEYENTDGVTYRYDVGANNYVEYGQVGDLYDLAGSVSQLQFSCYDACDLTTTITDVNSIRFVTLQTTLSNAATMGRDRTFTTQAYLRVNAMISAGPAPSFEGFTEAKAGSNTTSITIPTLGGSGNGVMMLGSWTSGLTHTAEAGSNRLLILTAHAKDNDADVDLQSVSYGGQYMTKVVEMQTQEGSDRAYVVAYVLDENGIQNASDNTFVTSWSSSPDQVGYSSVFLQNVDQSDPISFSDSNGDNKSKTISTGALSTDNGDMVIVAGTAGNTGSYSVRNGFTGAIELSIPSADGVAGYKAADGSSETPSIRHDNPLYQVIIGFVVKVAASGDVTGIEGNLLIAVVVTDGDNSFSLAPPAGEGWTQIDLDDYSSEVTLGAWWKVATASEPPSHQFTWSSSQQAYAWMMRFTGYDQNNPINALATDSGSSSTPICPSVTTTVENTMVLRLGGFDDDDITEDDPGLSGHTAITMDRSSSGSETVSGAAGYVEQSSIGSSGTANFSLHTFEEYRTITMAITPAGGGGSLRP